MALKTGNTKYKCRTCMGEGTDMCFLYDSYNIVENIHIPLSEVITLCTSIQICENDLLPQYLCKLCVNNARISYQFHIQCEKSDKILKSELLLRVKREPYTEQIDISDVGNEELSDGTLDTHLIKRNSKDDIKQSKCEKFKCLSCNVAFSKRKKLSEHLETHLEHKCTHCNASFPDVVNLRKHLRSHRYHEKQHLAVPAEQRSCDQCGKEFQYRSSMLKHRRKHDAPPKSCVYCDEVPATPAQLAQHMEKEHAHLKKIKCKVCDKMFFKEDNLRLHLITHSGIKRHICEVCGISFALAGNLAAHKRLHTGEKPYTCSHCGRGFAQQAALRSHEAGHSNKREHICTDCGAAFSRAGALRNHMKRHLPNRPFACSMCTKAFTFSSERKRHMTIHSGVKNHVCDVCGRRFNRNTNLKVHMRIHTGETPHICQTCGKGFIQAHCLRNHMNTHKQDDLLQQNSIL